MIRAVTRGRLGMAAGVGLAMVALIGCGVFASSRRRAASEEGPRWRAMHPRPRADGGVADGGDAGDASAADDAAMVVSRCPPAAVLVPGGTFTMGNDAPESAPDERPAHPVTLAAYCIDRTEVTVDRYAQCVTAGACRRAATALPQGETPVSGVDWSQADSFCRFVGGRLPTEAEWEFAARGTDGRAFPWGNDPPTDCTRMDWTVGGESCRGVGPSDVGRFPAGASPFGVLDMAGNVWEWTADWYTRTYAEGPQTQPTGPAEGSARVTRGGGWNNDQRERFRATRREGEHPAFRDYDLGFRCAYDAD